MALDWRRARADLAALAGVGDARGVIAGLRAALAHEESPRLFALGRKLVAQLAGSADLRAIGVRVLRSYTVEPLVAPLVARGLTHGLAISTSIGDYGQLEQELLTEPSPRDGDIDALLLMTRLEDLSVPLAVGFGSLSPAEIENTAREVSDRVASWIEAASRRVPRATIIVCGLVAPARPAYGLADPMLEVGHRSVVADINRRLAASARSSGAIYVELDHVVATVGSDNAFDARMNAHARQPYSLRGLGALAAHLARVLAAAFTPRKKCLVLDCDNTMWGGIVGEDGVDGIALGPEHPGAAFVAFQHALLDLHGRGVVLAIASKNNEADVLDVLDNHPHQVLHREHFAAWSISWDDKVAAIRSLAAAINIGIDSMVFIDDSEFECALVREQLPEVETIAVPANPLELAPLVHQIYSLDVLGVSEEDRQRGSIYRAQAARHVAERGAPSLEEFLRSLELELEIVRLDPGAAQGLVERAAQLTQRTNQLNATTRRYSIADIERFVADPTRDVLLARLRDRFGDHGNCGLAIVATCGEISSIDTFLLSCRVLGRGVEPALGVACERAASARRASALRAEYRQSAKNQQVADLFDRLGYSRCGDESGVGERHYEKLLADSTLETPRWFTLTGERS